MYLIVLPLYPYDSILYLYIDLNIEFVVYLVSYYDLYTKFNAILYNSFYSTMSLCATSCNTSIELTRFAMIVPIPKMRGLKSVGVLVLVLFVSALLWFEAPGGTLDFHEFEEW